MSFKQIKTGIECNILKLNEIQILNKKSKKRIKKVGYSKAHLYKNTKSIRKELRALKTFQEEKSKQEKI